MGLWETVLALWLGLMDCFLLLFPQRRSKTPSQLARKPEDGPSDDEDWQPWSSGEYSALKGIGNVGLQGCLGREES